MDDYQIVPIPRKITRRSGTFLLGPTTRIKAPGPARTVATLLHDALRPSTGLSLRILQSGEEASGDIVLTLRPDMAGEPESYVVDVSDRSIEIASGSSAGLSWGIQTLRQLLPADLFRSAPLVKPPYALPCVRIEDSPRFSWRGVMLDVVRHFMPKDFILRMIDLAALHKLNTFHLHLTDDQGWRMEVPSWPRLTTVGAWRRETAVGPVDAPTGYDGVPHGGFYTLSDLREIAAYAARRHVTVVPEFGFPGHTQAAIAAYPELGQAGQIEVATRWGHSPHVLAPTPDALRFVRDVLDVVVNTFPSPFVHIGGDECQREEWRASGYAAERAVELGLASVDAFQSWFLRHGVDLLDKAGRRAVGWDQVLEDGGVPDTTVIMAWRDFADDTAAEALAKGHDVIQCPTATTYLDHAQSASDSEPMSFYGVATLADVAGYDPDPAGSPWTGGGRVIGVQGHLWTEYMPTPRAVEYMAFPRLAGIADAAWSHPEQRRERPLQGRLSAYLARLDAIGIGYRPPSGPHPWQARRV